MCCSVLRIVSTHFASVPKQILNQAQFLAYSNIKLYHTDKLAKKAMNKVFGVLSPWELLSYHPLLAQALTTNQSDRVTVMADLEIHPKD